MQQIDSEDANFLFMEKVESPTHISLVYLYDQSALGKQQVRFSHIKEHVHNRLNSAPIFTQKIRRTPADIDYPYWVNDEKGEPLFVVTAEANAGLAKMLPILLVEVRRYLGERGVTIVFDRGGWSRGHCSQCRQAGLGSAGRRCKGDRRCHGSFPI